MGTINDRLVIIKAEIQQSFNTPVEIVVSNRGLEVAIGIKLLAGENEGKFVWSGIPMDESFDIQFAKNLVTNYRNEIENPGTLQEKLFSAK